MDSGDEMAQFIGAARRTCGFEEETPVATDEGSIPIREVDVGDRVLAWNETLGATGYYTVTDAYRVCLMLTLSQRQRRQLANFCFATD